MNHSVSNLQVCWFRTDLRIFDNPALAQAIKAGSALAVYIATPNQWQQHDDAPIKLDFWRRNLMELELELKRLNIELLIFSVADYSKIPALFAELHGKLAFKGLYYNREYPINERRRDELVDALLAERQVVINHYDDQVLLPPQNMLNRSGKPFKVFTPFAKALRRQVEDSNQVLTEPPKPLRGNALRLQFESISRRCEIADIPWPQAQTVWQDQWPAGELNAVTRLKKFVESRISSYAEARDFPHEEATSVLSPYLASGVLSVGTCWRSTEMIGENDGKKAWRNELHWRDFYRYIMYHFTRVSMGRAFRESTNSVPWQHDEESFTSWCEGQTGYPLVDAGMRQLKETGWMHNRLRMITAMFLCKHLLIDWRWGERWFMQNLIDGDFASNNGGWQWSASTGVDAVPYFRIFSPVRQSQRFDPDAKFIRNYVPEIKNLHNKQIHEPENDNSLDYPTPMIDHKFARERAIQTFKT